MQRKLVAILAADVVGYTRLMGQDEAGTLLRLKRFRAEVFDKLIGEHKGRTVKLMGDGALVEFASIVQAVAASVALQRAAAAWERDLPDDRRIRLRIGVNLGDVLVEGADLYGDGVNIAARLEGLAEAGGICVTQKVRDEVAGKLDVGFEDLGPVEVKNVATPVRVYRVSAPGAQRKTLALPDKPSIAVLPFANMSGDPEQTYFSDGITEDIITELSRFRTLFVIARNSSFVYRGKAVDLRQVGRELGVRYVVEGSVRRAGDRVRITAQLIEAESGSHIWAERYDRELADIFAVQDEITRVIVSTLVERLDQAEAEERKRRPRVDPSAYDLTLRAQDLYLRMTKDGYPEVQRLYKAAIAVDPGYATAHHRLAWSYVIAYELGWDDPKQLIAQAMAEARRAFELDPADARSVLALAYTCRLAGDFDGAEQHSRRALSMNPSDAEIAMLRGFIEVELGDAGGLSLMEQALRQNPFAPGWFLWVYGTSLYSLGRYEEARAAFREMKDMTTIVHAQIAAAGAQLGHMEEAKREMETFVTKAKKDLWLYPDEDPAAWRSFFGHLLRSRDPAVLDRWMDGFRKAGLPC